MLSDRQKNVLISICGSESLLPYLWSIIHYFMIQVLISTYTTIVSLPTSDMHMGNQQGIIWSGMSKRNIHESEDNKVLKLGL